ncbi:MAG: peroxide stress protein YaaA [Pseudomonadota bacterium]|jgi:cytoplasmic iron level regulating protein YaaA (DUF328/UPF0246 family)
MLLLLSPAKSLDFQTPPTTALSSQPDFLDHSVELVEQLRELAPSEIASLMSISDALALLNFHRFAEWALPFSLDNAKQAVLAFDGDVYDGLDALTLSEAQLQFAQQHLGILSGLYGLLKPLDLIQPYRLEMGTKFNNQRGKNLYAFWGNLLTDTVNQRLAEMPDPVLINLASEEYFKSIQPKQLRGEIIQPVFEDWKDGKYKIISFYAKRARGLMARFAIENEIQTPEALKVFSTDGYEFDPSTSDQQRWVFRRRIA